MFVYCREEYLAKIEKRIKTYDFQILNEPRPEKLLLVLDIDYTLFGELFVCMCAVELPLQAQLSRT